MIDSDSLASAFGMSTGPASESGVEEPFHEVENSHGRQDEHARAMNFVLWRTTLGYFLDQLINEIDGPDPGKCEGTSDQHGLVRAYDPIVRANAPPNPRFNYAKNMYGRVAVQHAGAGGLVDSHLPRRQPALRHAADDDLEHWQHLILRHERPSQQPWQYQARDTDGRSRAWDAAIVAFLGRCATSTGRTDRPTSPRWRTRSRTTATRS